MREHDLLKPALGPTLAVLRAIGPDQLDLPTPCTDLTVRGLLDHLAEWAPILAAAAGSPAAPAASLRLRDEPTELAEALTRLADAWSQPSAWAGTTTMGGGDPLPAAMVGGMALGEIVLHGWDLARATGRSPVWDAEVVAFLHREVERTAELGRQVKAYGPEFPVPETAPALDRALGLSGRDPNWTPAA
ncbi:TIGR03086 family metal-binding protein [Actinoplanes sp. NPDC049316]|uniref:TIGR03086 family metal-binding protein n=1 Tax=Actinoplanes sp. NPDC049316 TaxID=3154727 RepID=UPI0034323CE5